MAVLYSCDRWGDSSGSLYFVGREGFYTTTTTVLEARREGFLLHRVAQPPYASGWLWETGVEFLDTKVNLQRWKAVAGEMTKPRLDHHRIFRQDLGLMGRKGAIY